MTKYNMADVHKRFSDDIKQLNPELFGPLSIEAHRTLDEALRPKRGNKYGARKTEVDGKKFDSQKEANRYLVLKAQEEAGEISDLILQYEIMLQAGFVYRGEKVQPIRYTCDFCYVKDGKKIFEDVKSRATSRTADFRIRWRLLQGLFRDADDIVLLLTE